MSQPVLKALLFDMDDTLIDWSQRALDWSDYRHRHLEQVYDYIIREVHPLNVPDAFYEAASQLFEQAWLEAYQGMRAPHVGTVLARALETVGVPIEQINREAVLRAYNWQPVPGVVPFPDVLEILPILCDSGVKTGIITNSAQPMWMRDLELKAYGLLSHFIDCRLSAADVGYLKPHPAIFEAALACLGVRADEVVFVGDNPEADVAGAQSIGMRAILRIIPRAHPVPAHIEPDGTIHTFHDLLPLLDQWYPGWRVVPQLDQGTA